MTVNDNGNGRFEAIALGSVDPVHDSQQHSNRALCCDCVRAVLTERLAFLSRQVLHYRTKNDIDAATPAMRAILELLLFARFMEVWAPEWDVWLPLPELGYPTPSVTIDVKLVLGNDEPIES